MNNIKILLVEDHLLEREGFYNLVEEENDMKIVGETGIHFIFEGQELKVMRTF